MDITMVDPGEAGCGPMNKKFFEKKIFFEQVASLLYLLRAKYDFAVRLGLV
jgi:hypothetical protein